MRKMFRFWSILFITMSILSGCATQQPEPTSRQSQTKTQQPEISMEEPIQQQVEVSHECQVLLPNISDIYEGDCKQGLADGVGKAKGDDVYTGEFKGGKPHGVGLYEWKDGNSYEGEFVNGLPNGKGMKIWKNGDRYEGNFVDSRPHGKGIFISINGDRYEGEWKNGKKHGEGIEVLANGERYEGKWREGERYEECQVLDPNLSGIYIGACQNGIAEGVGKAKGKDIYEGEFIAGKPDGKGTIIYANGARYEGYWSEGKRHGNGIMTYPGGITYSGEWQDGFIVVTPSENNPDGKIYEIDYDETQNPLEIGMFLTKSMFVRQKNEKHNVYWEIDSLCSPQAERGECIEAQSEYIDMVREILKISDKKWPLRITDFLKSKGCRSCFFCAYCSPVEEAEQMKRYFPPQGWFWFGHDAHYIDWIYRALTSDSRIGHDEWVKHETLPIEKKYQIQSLGWPFKEGLRVMKIKITTYSDTYKDYELIKAFLTKHNIPHVIPKSTRSQELYGKKVGEFKVINLNTGHNMTISYSLRWVSIYIYDDDHIFDLVEQRAMQFHSGSQEYIRNMEMEKALQEEDMNQKLMEEDNVF